MSALIADYASSDEESSLPSIVAPNTYPVIATHEEEDVDEEDDEQLRLQARDDAFGLRMAEVGVDGNKRTEKERQMAVMAAPDVLREVGVSEKSAS